MIVRTLEANLVPFFGLFDLADARLLAAWAANGLVPQPVMIQLNFFQDLFRGPSPSAASLDAFLTELRREDFDAEICMFIRRARHLEEYEQLLHAALDRGVHLRVGLGDNAALFPTWTNANCVEHAASLCDEHGLTPVAPNQLRQRMSIPVRVR